MPPITHRLWKGADNKPTDPDTKHTKLAGLDHLRALAITLVIIFHYRGFGHPAWTEKTGSFGWTGVDLFFVLSGYLISGPLFRQIAGQGRISIKTFFVKRFFRIIPPYLVTVALYFCIPGFKEYGPPSPLWKYLTFTQNYGLSLHQYSSFSHAWSLCVEEQFYLLLPFLMTAVVALKWGRRSAFIIGGLFVLGFAVRLAGWYAFVQPSVDTDSFGLVWYRWMYYPTYDRLDPLLAGVTIAGLCQFYPRAKAFIYGKGNWLLLSGLVLAGIAFYVCLDTQSFATSTFGFPLVALAYGCIVASALSPRCILYRFRSRITAEIATLSYALYLTHKGIIHNTQVLLGHWGLDKDGNWMFGCCIAAALLGALAMRYIVEKPFMVWKDRLLKRMSPVPQTGYPLPGTAASRQNQNATILKEE
jgi:peptidoglycan/LPS O-acetylase OafA/YrhL